MGWDTDQFPTNVYLTTQIMYSILKYGGLAPGGVNFDAKVRRESFEPVDLFHAHIGGMDAFARSAVEYRYHVQAAFYWDGLVACGWVPQAFVFVCVETAPPYGVALYSVKPEDLDLGRAVYRRDLATYAECLRSGEWPGYPEEIRELELPGWARVVRVR